MSTRFLTPHLQDDRAWAVAPPALPTPSRAERNRAVEADKGQRLIYALLSQMGAEV